MTGGHHVHWPPLGLALLLALLGFWLNHVGIRPDIIDEAGFGHDPDYIVERFNALTFDASGRPRHRLIAERLTHYMDDDTTVLDKPMFTSSDPQYAVEIDAGRALVSADGNDIYFLNRVRVVQTPADGQPAISMATEYLRVTPDERTMRTSKTVTFRQGPSIITANEMFADGNARLVSLGGGVRGTYEKSN